MLLGIAVVERDVGLRCLVVMRKVVCEPVVRG